MIENRLVLNFSVLKRIKMILFELGGDKLFRIDVGVIV